VTTLYEFISLADIVKKESEEIARSKDLDARRALHHMGHRARKSSSRARQARKAGLGRSGFSLPPLHLVSNLDGSIRYVSLWRCNGNSEIPNCFGIGTYQAGGILRCIAYHFYWI